jgi:hypothetical protein
MDESFQIGSAFDPRGYLQSATPIAVHVHPPWDRPPGSVARGVNGAAQDRRIGIQGSFNYGRRRPEPSQSGEDVREVTSILTPGEAASASKGTSDPIDAVAIARVVGGR